MKNEKCELYGVFGQKINPNSSERWTAGCAAVYSRDVDKDMWQASVDRSWRFLKLAVRFAKQSNFAAEAQGV